MIVCAAVFKLSPEFLCSYDQVCITNVLLYYSSVCANGMLLLFSEFLDRLVYANSVDLDQTVLRY